MPAIIILRGTVDKVLINIIEFWLNTKIFRCFAHHQVLVGVPILYQLNQISLPLRVT